MEEQNKSSKGIIASVIALVLIIGGAVFALTRSNSKADVVVNNPTDTTASNTPPVQTPTTPSVPPATVPEVKKSIYKDGTYSADGSYNSPAGPESVTVQITLKNDIVTNATVTGNAQNGRSIRYQQAFIGGFSQYVIGKKIDSISLSRVSGSSLTPIGFNDALAQIKSQAKA